VGVTDFGDLAHEADAAAKHWPHARITVRNWESSHRASPILFRLSLHRARVIERSLAGLTG